MSATRDIVATYRGPGKVMRRLLGQGVREDRALIFLIVGCFLVFVAQTPPLARQAFETGTDLQMALGGALMGWIFIAPLLLYVIAAISAIVAKIFRLGITGFEARLALFWALLACCPLILLHGLVGGFVGPGIQLDIVGGILVAAFFWFWIAGLRAASQVEA